MQKVKPIIRPLERDDIPQIATSFEQLEWNKPASQYERYLVEQEMKARDVYVAFIEGQFTGYITICWSSSYEPFQKENIPEIADFNVLPGFRRQGIGAQLMDRAESEIAKVSSIVGIGVGLTPDYGAAQRLYVVRGYVPDGRGLHYKGHYPKFGEAITMDDHLTLYLTKKIEINSRHQNAFLPAKT